MGDRTTVTLCIPASLKEKADEILKSDLPEECGPYDDEGLYFYTFYEVNYGNLSLLNELRDNGIAYDSSWDDGGEYTAGTKHCRFTGDGDCKELEIYDSQINPDMDQLIQRIDNPVELRAYILLHKENTETLPWDNQEEFGKIFLAKKLIT